MERDLTDKEIREAMRKQVKGRWLFLLLITLVGITPAVLQAVFLYFVKIPLLPIIPNPLGILGFLLSFGVYRVSLEQTEGKEKKWSSLTFFLTPPLLGKALVLALLLWGMTWAVHLPGSLMEWLGTGLIAQVAADHSAYLTGILLRMAAPLLGFLALLFTGVMLMPLKYSFSVAPEERLKERLWGCLALGWHKFGRIFAYSLCLWLPPMLIGVGILLLGFWIMPLAAVLCFGVLLGFVPYISLAEAAFIKRLFAEEKREKKRELRQEKRRDKARN